jgi:mobilization protein NikA
MARPSNRRNETAPLTVRVSPAERVALRLKAERAGMRVSEAARAAFDAWEPARQEARPRRENAEFVGGE